MNDQSCNVFGDIQGQLRNCLECNLSTLLKLASNCQHPCSGIVQIAITKNWNCEGSLRTGK